MQFIKMVSEMKEFSRKARERGKKIGFVPTMGYLHEGHMSLVKAAREECDLIIMSIFVNPAQFAPEEDFDKYPRDMERDKRIAEEGGVDCIFAPSSGEMYPEGHITYIEPEGPAARVLCGRSRPGHFRGVTTVVAKLFNIVKPHRSYFGQKDAQQAALIKQMVKDLNMDTDIKVMPIVRESDNLAMSSRNTYLSRDERGAALALYGSLEHAESMIKEGEFSSGKVKEEMKKILFKKGLKIDYVDIVDADSLEEVDKIKNNTLIAIAAFAGKTRLIDNVIIYL
jgi:pantoate--beta-alanine ligase